MAFSKKFLNAWRIVLRYSVLIAVTLFLTLATGAAVTFYRFSSHSLSMSSEPEPIVRPSILPKVHTSKHKSPKIALLCSPMGSTPFETLVPLSILKEVHLVSYSDKTRRCRIAPGLSLIPHHALLDHDLPEFEAWIVPPLAASDSAQLWQKLIAVLTYAPKLLVFGESVRFAAMASPPGKMPTRLAVPYSTQKEISKTFPEARWISGQRVVIHQRPQRLVISSPGLAATAEATQVFGDALTDRKSTTKLNALANGPLQIPRLSIPNLLQFVRWVGFQPRALRAQLTLRDQTNEWGLGALLEVFGKSGAVEVLYPSPDQSRRFSVRTKHGYQLEIESPQDTREADLVLTPPTADLDQAQASALEQLYAAIGVGSESWIQVFAARLMLHSPAFERLGVIPTKHATAFVFLLSWLVMTAFALIFATLGRQLFFKSTRLHSNSPLFKKRRGKSK